MGSSDVTSASVWQSDAGVCAAVLYEVFLWLEAEQLCAASGACRAWRRAAAAPALWRRLLQRRAAGAESRLAALRVVYGWDSVCWRTEYVRSFAGWERAGAAAAPAPDVRHAALAADGRLALVCADASLSVWDRGERAEGEAWRRCWSTSMHPLGWTSAERVQWAPGGAGTGAGARLLVAGVLALSDSWELVVFRLDDCGHGRVEARERCGAGAAGCWTPRGDAFLSLELHVLAPAVAATIVRLNAVTQETESEYVGVRSALLCIYNEPGHHITHAVVVEAPSDGDADAGGDHDDDDDDELGYFHATLEHEEPAPVSPSTLLVAAYSVRGAGGGLSTWLLQERRPAPLCALAGGGDLAARVRRHRAARAAAAPPTHPAPPAPPEPRPASPERTLREACTAPARTRLLPAPVQGLVPHHTARCVWVSLLGGGAWCLALPTLRVLRRLSHPAPPAYAPTRSALHYVQPALHLHYLASPEGGWRGGVLVWSALSGAACPSERVPAHRAPPIAVLLPPSAEHRASPHTVLLPPVPDELLVLAGDEIQVWKSRASVQPLLAEL